MPRIKYVKKAQQRYGTKPVLDPETGEQVKVPLRSKRTGEQLKDKHGRLRWQRQSVRDLAKPLPMPRCDFCHEEIAVGDSYAIAPLRYGKKYRHTGKGHPAWQEWDLSSSMRARLAQAIAAAEDNLENLGEFDDTTDVEQVLQDLADEVRALAEERNDAADRIEDGFGHEVPASEELRQHGQDLEAFADELEGWSADEEAPTEDEDRFNSIECDVCDGTGEVDNPDYDPDDEESEEPETVTCDNCDGDGEIPAEEDFEETISQWRDEVLDSAREAMANTPDVG